MVAKICVTKGEIIEEIDLNNKDNDWDLGQDLKVHTNTYFTSIIRNPIYHVGRLVTGTGKEAPFIEGFEPCDRAEAPHTRGNVDIVLIHGGRAVLTSYETKSNPHTKIEIRHVSPEESEDPTVKV
ncbi:MAG: hypothetical protein WC596_03060 [Candidatus Shapirobacteria bacterium]